MMDGQVIGAALGAGFALGATFVAFIRFSDRPEKKPSKPLLTWEDGWRQGRQSGERDGRWKSDTTWRGWWLRHDAEFHPQPKRSDVDIEATAYARGYQNSRVDNQFMWQQWMAGHEQAYACERRPTPDVF